MANPEAPVPLDYRAEVLAPVFQALRAGDSCAVVAPASMGKSRLVRCLLQPALQQHYLAEQAALTRLVVVDCNRLAECSSWGLYELLLTTLVETSTGDVRGELNSLRREALLSRDEMLARRHTELAMQLLDHEQRLHLCLLLDEFDEAYSTLPACALANLRALRDMHKYRLCYVLLLRDHPGRLRPSAEVEGFYELFSRSVYGLGPLQPADAGLMLDQLEARKQHKLAPAERSRLIALSGGHPGSIVALFDLLRAQPAAPAAWTDWASAQPTVIDECRKIWHGLAEDERLELNRVSRGLAASAPALRELLRLKGLISAQDTLFSPLFNQFVRRHGAPADNRMRIDPATRTVWVAGQHVEGLTPREYDLLLALYQRHGEVCTRDELLQRVYPQDAGLEGSDNRLDTLVRRVREKIEPVREQPRYLLTVRGVGYRLAERAEPAAE